MSGRAARGFAIVGSALALVGAVGAIGLRLIDPVPLLPGEFGFSDTALVGFELLGVTFASVGALLVVRRPINAETDVLGVVEQTFHPASAGLWLR